MYLQCPLPETNTYQTLNMADLNQGLRLITIAHRYWEISIRVETRFHSMALLRVQSLTASERRQTDSLTWMFTKSLKGLSSAIPSLPWTFLCTVNLCRAKKRLLLQRPSQLLTLHLELEVRPLLLQSEVITNLRSLLSIQSNYKTAWNTHAKS